MDENNECKAKLKMMPPFFEEVKKEILADYPKGFEEILRQRYNEEFPDYEHTDEEIAVIIKTETADLASFLDCFCTENADTGYSEMDKGSFMSTIYKSYYDYLETRNLEDDYIFESGGVEAKNDKVKANVCDGKENDN